MDLILVRHGRACERDSVAWPDDARRPLTVAGRDEFAQLAKRLGRAIPKVDLVESSGFVRAWQTARLLQEHAGWCEPVRAERLEGDESDLAPGETLEQRFQTQLDTLMRAITATRGIDTVVWVGHEPTLSHFASLLLCGSAEGARVAFKKGAAVALRISEDVQLRDSTGARMNGVAAELLWMVTPGLVSRMRRP